MKHFKIKRRGNGMVLKIVFGVVGAILIAGVAMVGPDIKRYMKLRAM